VRASSLLFPPTNLKTLPSNGAEFFVQARNRHFSDRLIDDMAEFVRRYPLELVGS
jgi:hypothetical protein